MITRRPANERGSFNHGWLKTAHTFSFADYRDPRHMGFRTLRVINDDVVAPGAGFPTHGHHDMEIVTYILEGELEHKDSMGNSSRIRRGEIQRMSAGTGVTHSEYNPSHTQPLHLLQIWILPNQKGLKPGYEQKSFPLEDEMQNLRMLASPDGRDGSIKLHQDVFIFGALLTEGETISHELDASRYAWLHVADGELRLNGEVFKAGDGAALEKEARLDFVALSDCEFLLFDLN